MKKRIVALVLLLVMLLSVSLVSCNKDSELEETSIKVYTLYSICEEGTTEEAIKAVELSLNMSTVYTLGFGVKLCFVTEDEYDQLIEDKYAEIENYQEEQKNKKNDKNNTSSTKSEASVADSDNILTADEYIDMLKRGEEYVFDAPRLDIFLVRGFENYIDLVGQGKLAELDEKLSSEAKLIKDKIHPTFLNAAKVTNASGRQKTYGVPMNTAIGEYEYVVFDEELLQKYEIDAMTMNTLEDLESYLRLIKENEPDVVPLANAFDSTYCNYLFASGFPAMVDPNGTVLNPYENITSRDYYTYISRYRTLGYLDDSDSEKRFAVKFIKGTFEDLEALEKQTGRKYVSAVHSYPVPTNENTLKNLFCVSKYVVSNELTAVANLLAYIETNADAANLLTYGVEHEHYTLNNNNQVVRKNNDYIVNPEYMGNSFLTYTIEGENPNKWEMFKAQNLDSSKSVEQTKLLGFAYYPNSFEDPDNSSIIYEEPNYVDIIKPLADAFYKDILSGKLGSVDYAAEMAQIKATVDKSLVEGVAQSFIDELTNEKYREIEAYFETEAYINSIYEEARLEAIESFITTRFKNDAKRALQQQISADYPELTASQAQEKLNELYTDEYLKNRVIETVDAKEIDAKTASTINDKKAAAIKAKKDALPADPAFIAEKNALLSSPEYEAEKNAVLNADNYYLYQDELTKIINQKIKTLYEDLNTEFSDSIKVAYEEFIAEMIANFDYDDSEKRSAAFYNTALENLANQEENLKAIKNALSAEIKNKLTEENGGVAPNPEDVADQVEKSLTSSTLRKKVIELNLVTDAEIKAEYDSILSAYINKAVGLKDQEETTPEGSETPDVENPDVVDDTDYFKLFFVNRLEKQYYTFRPQGS